MSVNICSESDAGGILTANGRDSGSYYFRSPRSRHRLLAAAA